MNRKFFNQDTLTLCKKLLGCKLIVGRIAGKIVEVEAYRGDIDPACHCYYKRTERNEVMFWDPGHIYVYFIYGVYHCVNIVAEKKDFGAAVLIRALEPIDGLDLMHRRLGYNGEIKEKNLCNGPGKLCKAMGINKSFNAEHLLQSKKIKLEKGEAHTDNQITISTRIGISKAVDLPWRFYISDSEFVSKR